MKKTTLHMEINYLSTFFLILSGAEGDRVTSPARASTNWSIDASRSSLEGQMECYFIQLVGKVGYFTHKK